MTTVDLAARKERLRRRMKQVRSAMTADDRAYAAQLIWWQLFELDAYTSAAQVLAFMSFGAEPDTHLLHDRVRDDGKTLLLPRVVGDSLEPVAHFPGGDLLRSPFGVLESTGPPTDHRAVDLVVVPGLAFDRDGNRLGFGAGYYDRFLPTLRSDAAAWGVAFASQLVDEVPHGRDDVRVHGVVTDAEVVTIDRLWEGGP